MSILTVLVIGILVLSGLAMAGVTTLTCNQTTVENHPPGKPSIKGPTAPKPGTHKYTFGAIDPDRDKVFYEIEWGDGTNTSWIGPYYSGEVITRSHTYNLGLYIAKARAKDIHGAIGPWGTIPIEISQSKQMINPIFFQFVEQFMERFPMLE